METLVEQILQATKSQKISLSPRQRFFQEFDRALAEGADAVTLGRLEQYGRAAGLSELELAQRQGALAWTLAQAA